ncbi:MAG TPA: transglutaminase domain-containing protein [Candidatus Binatia bacterium]|nr:transglutaminase domain-containing protein [Candidatus Binatia bacterium]
MRLCRAVFLWAFLATVSQAQLAPEGHWWSAAVESRLGEAGTNRLELVKALNETPAPRREGMAFLLENMPAADLKSLGAAFLLENLNLAYEAWETSPWHAGVSNELFLNEVLPYACMSEERDPWRARLRALCLPLVAECKTPGEAAQLLNRKIFPLLKVRYNTSRRRPDQSPRETSETGVATCTGLAILLVDACRSVGIPARVAGTPMWANMRGNHTWVEVWDGGWHFAGAAEPDRAGLDHAWFVHDASEAQRDVAQHAIYATSFRRTEVCFPLVWAPGDESVSAVNVTDRYAAKAPVATEGAVRVAVKVIESNGKRAVADLLVSEAGNPATNLKEKSRGETADLNDLATFKLMPGRKYHVNARLDNREAETDVTVTEVAEQLVTLTLAERPAAPSEACQAVSQPIKPLPTKDVASLKSALSGYFTADVARQAKWKFPARLEKLLRQNEPAVRQIAWETYRSAPIHAALKADFDAHVVNFEKYQSPYTVKTVGQRPAKGWALFIAMHGGGGAPKEVNDSQWKQMRSYYKDHPGAGGYIYLALRAPNDTWNGFYDNYVYPLIDNLIRQFRLFGDIDSDKVFIMGYSHGGYGAYAIGPKMPDRFAAIHASAAAATDGETTAKTLRTTPFTVMVGERDTMYGRYERNLKFKDQVEKLRGGRTDIYPVTVTIISGNGHTGLPDRDKITQMYPAVRNPVPRELDWLMTDNVVQDFFWLRATQPGKRQEILASVTNNRFVITANENVSAATVFMDARLVDFSKPVDIELNGSTTTRRFEPGLKTFCETLARRGDPGYAFCAAFEVVKDAQTGRLTLAPPAK